jgi:hypothetical protein
MRMSRRALGTMGLLVALVALAGVLAVMVAPGQQLAARHARLLPVVRRHEPPTITTGPATSTVFQSPPTTPIRTVPYTHLVQYAPPPYIAEATAQAMAMRTANAMGGGHIVQTKLETLTAAGQAIGDTVNPPNVARTRVVWLIWLVGTWQGGCLTTDCPSQPDTLYYAVFDAKTGTSFGYGTGFDMPGAPVEGPGVHLGNST